MSDTLAQGAALMPVIISTWTRSRYVKVRSGRIGACERPPPGPVTASASRQNVNPYRDATFLAMDDFLFAALFLCMTPLLTALSRSVARAFVLMRFSWDLIFATWNLSHIRVGRWCSVMRATEAARDRAWGYPWLSRSGWNCMRTRPERARDDQI